MTGKTTGIERLRKLAEDLIPYRLWVHLTSGTEKDWDCYQGDCRTVSDVLRVIADQIECESDVETVRSDAMEAWRWVREHGGLDHVKAEWSSRVPHDLYERRRQRLLGHIAECEAALGRRNVRIEELGKTIEFFQLNNSNFRHLLADVAERLGFTRYGDDYEPEDLLDALDRRLMPEGCEWMLWDDGKPVTYDDAPDDVIGVYLALDGSGYVLMTDLPDQLMSEPSERVRRPAVLAADGEPLKVGQTAWHVATGREYTVRGCTNGGAHLSRDGKPAGYCRADCLTHKRPVLDADGLPIRVDDTVWHVESGERCKVVEVDSRSVSVDFCVEDVGTKHTGCVLPANLTHRAPVLAADGRPLREGETVWDTDAESDTPLTVVEVSSDLIRCEYTWKDGKTYRPCYPPDQLTHTKPETPESWERIEGDCSISERQYYAQRIGHDVGLKDDEEVHVAVSLDLVRRCRALAERERGE